MYAALKKVEQMGYEGVEQDMPSLDKTPVECAKLAIDYLKFLSEVS